MAPKLWRMHAPGSPQIAPYISLNLAVSGASAKAVFLFTARACVQGTLLACAGTLSTLRLLPESPSTTEASYHSITPQVKASFGLSFSLLYLLIHFENKISQDIIILFYFFLFFYFLTTFKEILKCWVKIN